MTEDNCRVAQGAAEEQQRRDVDCNRNNSNWKDEGGLFRNGPKGLLSDVAYDDLSRNIDANLAEIDMEHFRSEDIESILALPAMRCERFQCPPRSHGEMAAELSLSLTQRVNDLFVKDDWAREDEDEDEDMSVCKSEPLFSPLKERSVLPSFSVDSLDCDSYDEQELMLTCRANKNNYTIAFEGSSSRLSDDSDCRDMGSLVRSDFAFADQHGKCACKSRSLPNLFKRSCASVPIFTARGSSSKGPDLSLVTLFMRSKASSSSDYSSAIVRQQRSAMYRSERSDGGQGPQEQSPSSPVKAQVASRNTARCSVDCDAQMASPIQEVDENDSSEETATVPREKRPGPTPQPTSRCQATSPSSSGYLSFMGRNNNNNNNNSDGKGGRVIISRSESRATQIPVHVSDEAVQTSLDGGGGQPWTERVVEEPPKKSVYICYPNYSLPDLQFLRMKGPCGLADAEMYLMPSGHEPRSPRDEGWAERRKGAAGLDTLRKADLNSIQDLDSLCVLLPTDVRRALSDMRSGERCDSAASALKRLLVYDYDSDGCGSPRPPQPPPPLPKRSVSLLNEDPSRGKGIRPDGGEMPAEAPPRVPFVAVGERRFGALDDWPSPLSEESDAEAPPQQFAVSPDLDALSDDGEALVVEVGQAVRALETHFSSTDPREKFVLGSSILSPVSGHLVVEKLCPALRTLLSDGLKLSLYGLFGKIPNSVWKVVETSCRAGVTSRALNDLVARINGESGLADDAKFNAFVVGLLNIRSVDSWLAFLRSQNSSIIREHYDGRSFLARSNDGATKALFERLVSSLQPLALLPFDVDLLFERLHADCGSTCRACPKQQTFERGASRDSAVGDSCSATWACQQQVSEEAKKEGTSDDSGPRSSSDDASLNTVLVIEEPRGSSACSSEDTDSGPCTQVSGEDFKRLQKKWEMLSGASDNNNRNNNVNRSRIPRLVCHGSPGKAAAAAKCDDAVGGRSARLARRSARKVAKSGKCWD